MHLKILAFACIHAYPFIIPCMVLPPKVEFRTKHHNIHDIIQDPRSIISNQYNPYSCRWYFFDRNRTPHVLWNYFPASHFVFVMMFPSVFSIFAPQAYVTLKCLLWAFPLQSFANEFVIHEFHCIFSLHFTSASRRTKSKVFSYLIIFHDECTKTVVIHTFWFKVIK